MAFVTDFFADFLATDNIDELVALLKKARLDDRLLEFFPPQQRSLDQFNTHFKVRALSRQMGFESSLDARGGVQIQ